ncbi:DNA replication protein [Puttea exsequens]|nr:DNA replication protein [Puttea exsequens]
MGSYYNIDDILTDAQKVPCTFSLDIPGLGFLDDHTGGDIKASQPLPLPLWLSTLLTLQNIGPGGAPLCELDLPASLSQRVLNALEADPRTVDLRAQCGHFYGLAEKVLELVGTEEESEAVVGVLSETFQRRAREIGNHANNLRGALGEGADFLRGLDEMERQLFRAAHESSKATRVWMGEMKKKS